MPVKTSEQQKIEYYSIEVGSNIKFVHYIAAESRDDVMKLINCAYMPCNLETLKQITEKEAKRASGYEHFAKANFNLCIGGTWMLGTPQAREE